MVTFDTGWLCSYFEYASGLKEIGFSMKNVKYAIVSHFHMDHAGLVGEMIRNGITCLAFEKQLQSFDNMEEQSMEYDLVLKSTWQHIRELGARRICPAHSSPYILQS